MHNFACTVKRTGGWRVGVGGKCCLKSLIKEKLASECRACPIFSKSLAFLPHPEMTSGQGSTCFQQNLTKGSLDNIWRNKPVLLLWPTNKDVWACEVPSPVSRSHLFSLLHSRVPADGKWIIHVQSSTVFLLLRKVLKERCRIYSSQLTTAGFFLSTDWSQWLSLFLPYCGL